MVVLTAGGVAQPCLDLVKYGVVRFFFKHLFIKQRVSEQNCPALRTGERHAKTVKINK